MTNSQRWMLLAGLVLAGFLVYLLQPILTPFLMAALLAYLGDPLADRLEARRVPRTAAVTIVFAALIGLIFALSLLLIPMIGSQVEALREALPAMIRWAEATALPWVEQRLGVELREQLALDQVAATISSNWRETGNLASEILARVSRSGLALAGWLVNLALIPVVTFYLLRDWDILVGRVRDLLPRSKERVISRLAGECDEVLGAFLRGQFLVMLALGVVYTAGLWLLGLDLALLIGMTAGLASIVPYLGTIIGVGAALLAAMFQFGDIWYLVGVAVIFGIGQMLEGMVLTPLLVGDRIGLHPVAVIFAVLAGGQLFGFVGVLLALPVAAVVMVLLRHVHDLYKDSELYGTASEGGTANERE